MVFNKVCLIIFNKQLFLTGFDRKKLKFRKLKPPLPFIKEGVSNYDQPSFHSSSLLLTLKYFLFGD